MILPLRSIITVALIVSVWCRHGSSSELSRHYLQTQATVVNTWTKTSASNYDWHSIASDSTGRYLVTCSNNLKGVYISSSYGVTWSQSSAPTTFDYTGVASSWSGTKLVAVIGGTVAGGIYVSPDTGLNWVQTPAPTEAWNSVTCDSSCTYVVAVIYSSVLSSGGIYYSQNSGVTFTESDAPQANWNGVASDSSGQYVVAVIYNTVLGGGGIYRSSNFGANWVQVSTLAYDWTGIASDSTGTRLVAVSSGGTIAVSTDHGATWTLPTVPNYNYNCVSMDSTGMYVNVAINSNIGGVGSGSGIYRSTDGGVTWTITDAPGESYTSISSDSTGEYVFAASTNDGIWGVIYSETTTAPTAVPTLAPAVPTPAPVPDITLPPVSEAPSAVQTLPPTVAPSPIPAPSPGPTSTVVPSANPTLTPSAAPVPDSTVSPTSAPVSYPSVIPTVAPVPDPSVAPTAVPVSDPTASPSAMPVVQPSFGPSPAPVAGPTFSPSVIPTGAPVPDPSLSPSLAPVPDPTLSPSLAPISDPTASPSAVPVAEPSPSPTSAPFVDPTGAPVSDPSASPTIGPTPDLSVAPTAVPAADPSVAPTAPPVPGVTESPSAAPVADPTANPSEAPVSEPTTSPSVAPTTELSVTPTVAPVADPSVPPTAPPVPDITASPSAAPAADPSVAPTTSPTEDPTTAPTEEPTATPTDVPAANPTTAPTSAESSSPTVVVSVAVTALPTSEQSPVPMPSSAPQTAPTSRPSTLRTVVPTVAFTEAPLTVLPTSRPSSQPSSSPSIGPQPYPSSAPSASPLIAPRPSAVPTEVPSAQPTVLSSTLFTPTPSATPTAPSAAPTVALTRRPTAPPSANDTSTQIVSFTTNVTLTGLTTALFDQASQTSLITTNAEIMHVSITDVSYLGSVTVSSTVSSVSVRQMQVSPIQRSLRRAVSPLDTFSAVAITLTEVAMSSTVFPSPEALYQSLTAAMTAAVQNGVYDTVLRNSAVIYGASQLTDASATAVESSPVVVSQISAAPSQQPTGIPHAASSHDSHDLQLVLEIVSILPGILLMLVGAFTIRYRKPREGTLNQLRALPAEYGHLFIRGVTLVLSVNLLLTSSLTFSDPTFLLLLVSRLLILSLCVVFFLFFIFPAKEELNSVTGTSLLIRTDVLQENGAVSVYSVVIVMGLFDMSMLRYLPWFRTSFTAVMDGYPNILLVRCSLYGTFFSSVIQTAAVLPALVDHNNTSTRTAIKVVALLVFNIINIVRSFMSIILHMKKVKDIDHKLAIVSENDVAALADFVSSTAHTPRTSKDLRGPIAADKVSDMLSVAARSTRSHTDADGDADSSASTLNVHNLGALKGENTENPLHSQSLDRDEDVMSEMTEDVDMDERGILFATKINHADETVNILRDQVRLAGLRPLEFIPLPKLKAELEVLFGYANSGTPYDTDRLDYLLMCLDHNPEYKAEQEAANRAWRADIEPFLQESLEAMQAFISPNIFKCSESSLIHEYGYSKALAKRIIVKKCLWLVRISTKDIDRMHIAELNGRFNPEAQNLDIVEAAAIFAVLPAQFGLDADRRKTRWRASIEQNLKTLYKQFQAGLLPGPKKRNPVYKNQVPAFDGRETLHEMGATKNEDAFAPRTSFLHMSLPRQVPTALQTGADSSDGVSPQSGSYVQKMGQNLSKDLFHKPRTPSGQYEAGAISGTNRSSLTMLPSAVNSPAGSTRKTEGTSSSQAKSSNFGSELAKALTGRTPLPPSKKHAEDDLL